MTIARLLSPVTVSCLAFLAVCVPAVAAGQTPVKTWMAATPLDVRPPPAAAPVQEPASAGDLHVSIYPVLLWVPAFTATASVPPFPDTPDGPDLPGGSGSTSTSFDGAFLAGLSLEQARWRVDADGIWAALVTQRDRPLLNVDLDVVYGHVSGGVRIVKRLYVTGGVRRLALNYDISLEGRTQHFVRKPGIWDPLVGLAWHSAPGSRWVLHVTGEGGGFGAGADVDLAGSVRADLKIVKHFGVTLGYTALYLKLSDTVLDRTFEVKQTLHGPVLGVGFYF